jgi:ABC-type cobalamin transport system permease subunit
MSNLYTLFYLSYAVTRNINVLISIQGISHQLGIAYHFWRQRAVVYDRFNIGVTYNTQNMIE